MIRPFRMSNSCDCSLSSRQLGLIDQSIKDVICNVYILRNAIHLHAELRRCIEYEIDVAKQAYWRLKGFCQQISEKLLADGKVSPPPEPLPKTPRSSIGSSAKTNEQISSSWFKRLIGWFAS